MAVPTIAITLVLAFISALPRFSRSIPIDIFIVDSLRECAQADQRNADWNKRHAPWPRLLRMAAGSESNSRVIIDSAIGGFQIATALVRSTPGACAAKGLSTGMDEQSRCCCAAPSHISVLMCSPFGESAAAVNLARPSSIKQVDRQLKFMTIE